jgi:hypothetical protein
MNKRKSKLATAAKPSPRFDGSESLSRCPFCGSDNLDLMHWKDEGDNWQVECCECRATGPGFRGAGAKYKAVKAWNLRNPNIGGEGRAASARTSPPPCSAVPMPGEIP